MALRRCWAPQPESWMAMQSLAGSFLVARPILQDGHFKHSVVLILQHDNDGAYGLVVNRPLKSDELPFPIFAGGPCTAPGLVMLHGHADWVEEEADENDDDKCPEVAPGV